MKACQNNVLHLQQLLLKARCRANQQRAGVLKFPLIVAHDVSSVSSKRAQSSQSSSCIIHVSIGVILALVLYKKPRGWKFVRTAYMIPNIISNAAMGMIFLNIFNPQYGVVNSILKAVGLESLTHNWLMDTTTAFPSVTMTWLLFAGYTTTLVLAEGRSSCASWRSS